MMLIAMISPAKPMILNTSRLHRPGQKNETTDQTTGYNRLYLTGYDSKRAKNDI